MNIPIKKPSTDSVPSYFHQYLDGLPDRDMVDILRERRDSTFELINNIQESLAGYSYAPGKWTIAQVLLHIIDTERIMAYRALCFSRRENANLPGFDEDNYVENCGAEHRTLHDLAGEFLDVRNSTLSLFRNLSEEMLERKGMANSKTVSVNLLGWVIAGHTQHHLNVLMERYLNH